ncbi:hypothetical protein BMS3Bbin04_00499 [bacterium BMS3Bbin04]|nr:hypothetical protein BMS3Bbin04_00499 [bacterium BMS3Bbin04]
MRQFSTLSTAVTTLAGQVGAVDTLPFRVGFAQKDACEVESSSFFPAAIFSEKEVGVRDPSGVCGASENIPDTFLSNQVTKSDTGVRNIIIAQQVYELSHVRGSCFSCLCHT